MLIFCHTFSVKLHELDCILFSAGVEHSRSYTLKNPSKQIISKQSNLLMNAEHMPNWKKRIENCTNAPRTAPNSPNECRRPGCWKKNRNSYKIGFTHVNSVCKRDLFQFFGWKCAIQQWNRLCCFIFLLLILFSRMIWSVHFPLAINLSMLNDSTISLELTKALVDMHTGVFISLNVCVSCLCVCCRI